MVYYARVRKNFFVYHALSDFLIPIRHVLDANGTIHQVQ